MKFAFCLYHYFPTGGLQQDFFQLLQHCLANNLHIDIYTTRWSAALVPNTRIVFIKTLKWTNHQRMLDFARQCNHYFKQTDYDLIVGFNKVPGLDVYFAADDCYPYILKQTHARYYAHLPRARTYKKLEAPIFSENSHTHSLLIAPQQWSHYYQYYRTPPSRCHLLPPSYKTSPLPTLATQHALRKQYTIEPHDWIILFVATSFKTKGLKRLLRAVAQLPATVQTRTHCWIIGQENSIAYERFSQRLAHSVCLHFLGLQTDLSPYYATADLLVHPAYHEAAGKVLLEAMHCGTAILTTAACGYSPYVQKAKAGVVLPLPFKQKNLNQTLSTMLNRSRLKQWGKSAQHYVTNNNFPMDMHAIALEHLIKIAKLKKQSHSFVEDVTQKKKFLSSVSQQPNKKLSLFLHGDEKKHASLIQWLKAPELLKNAFSLEGTIFRDVPSRRTLQFKKGMQTYFIKLHFGVGWREIFKNLMHLRPPILSACNEWQATQYLQILNIPTTPPISYATQGMNPAQRRSFLITEAIPQLRCLDELLMMWQTTPPSPRVRRSWIKRIATLVGTLHAAGINHCDCYLCHFATHTQINPLHPLTENTPVYLLDLHRAQIHPTLGFRWRVKDLAALYYSTRKTPFNLKDRLYFIQNYHQQPLRNSLKQHQTLWKRVESKEKRIT